MTEQPPKPRRGCFFYGCLTGLVLMVLLAVGGLVAVHYAKKAISGLVNQYTDTKPMTLPTVPMSPADAVKLQKRWQAFVEAVRARRPTEPLVLTADEINALIANRPDKQSVKGKFYVSLDDGRVKAELSVPLKEIGWKVVKDRYLNGSGTFNVSVQDGVLLVTPQAIEVKGKPVPDQYMQGLRHANFAAVLTNQPGTTALVQGLQEIQVKPGRLIVMPKAVVVEPAEKP